MGCSKDITNSLVPWVEYDTALEGLEYVFWTLTIRACRNQSPYFTAEEIEV